MEAMDDEYGHRRGDGDGDSSDDSYRLQHSGSLGPPTGTFWRRHIDGMRADFAPTEPYLPIGGSLGGSLGGLNDPGKTKPVLGGGSGGGESETEAKNGVADADADANVARWLGPALPPDYTTSWGAHPPTPPNLVPPSLHPPHSPHSAPPFPSPTTAPFASTTQWMPSTLPPNLRDRWADSPRGHAARRQRDEHYRRAVAQQAFSPTPLAASDPSTHVSGEGDRRIDGGAAAGDTMGRPIAPFGGRVTPGPLMRRLYSTTGVRRGEHDTPQPQPQPRQVGLPADRREKGVALLLMPTEEDAMAHIAHATTGTADLRIQAPHDVARQARRVRITELLRTDLLYGAQRTRAMRPALEPHLPLHLVALLQPRQDQHTILLSRWLFPPSVAFAPDHELGLTTYRDQRQMGALGAWLHSATEGGGFAHFAENSPMLRLALGALWLRQHQGRNFVAEALNRSVEQLDTTPDAHGPLWQPRMPQAVAFAPIRLWQDGAGNEGAGARFFPRHVWRARYYTALFRQLSFLCCDLVTLQAQTAMYLGYDPHDVPVVPGVARDRMRHGMHQALRRERFQHTPERAWEDYIAYLASANCVPRVLVRMRLEEPPATLASADGRHHLRWGRRPDDNYWPVWCAEQYAYIIEEMLSDLPELAIWRNRVAAAWSMRSQDVTLWLAEPLVTVSREFGGNGHGGVAGRPA